MVLFRKLSVEAQEGGGVSDSLRSTPLKLPLFFLTCRPLPMDDVRQKIVVPQPVLGVHLLIVHRQGPVQDTALLEQEDDGRVPSRIQRSQNKKMTSWSRIKHPCNMQPTSEGIITPRQSKILLFVNKKYEALIINCFDTLPPPPPPRGLILSPVMFINS